jgi:peroxiredoxin
MKLKLRDLVLAGSAVVITALCWWRTTTPVQHSAATDFSATDRRPAPAFELYDQNSHLVKLDAYLHRHTIALVFFDGSQDPETIDALVRFREFHPALKSNGVIVIGVSNALPQRIRAQSVRPFPFPILADINAGQPGSASLEWGCAVADQPDGRYSIRSALFLIDRTGLVSWHNNLPIPEQSPEQVVTALIAGEK